jgi:hypothetical protein
MGQCMRASARGPESTEQSRHEDAPGRSIGRTSQELKPGAEECSGSNLSETKGQSPNGSDQDKRDSGMKSSSDISKDQRIRPWRQCGAWLCKKVRHGPWSAMIVPSVRGSGP